MQFLLNFVFLTKWRTKILTYRKEYLIGFPDLRVITKQCCICIMQKIIIGHYLWAIW